MKIRSVKAVEIDRLLKSRLATCSQDKTEGFCESMQRYPELKRSDWGNEWNRTACVVTADDGTWGFGLTLHSGSRFP
ncbi:MAG: hypothetical protein Ct9H300mP19_05860 [Dehalococcoidia bacterium]|nr:MAG: hypothetical protein Ct9H300mP19_05860 [Dehalococcoidia bacterium]